MGARVKVIITDVNGILLNSFVVVDEEEESVIKLSHSVTAKIERSFETEDE